MSDIEAARPVVGITGAGGNVGTTLRRGLAGRYDLRLFDLYPIQGATEPQVQVDFADPARVAGCFDGLDALLHIAGNPRPDARPEETIRNNFVATSYVFEEARRAGVKRIVFASSNFYHEGAIGEALRSHPKRLIRLDDAPTPQCMYARSKVYGEHLGFHLSTLGMQFVAMRIGWTVPGDDPRPYWGAYMRAMWCSHRDLVQAFDCALRSEAGFVAAFAISNNPGRLFDLEETRERLGFVPEDSAEGFAGR